MWFMVCNTLFIAWAKEKSSTQRDGHKLLLLIACDLYSLLGKSWELTENKEKERNVQRRDIWKDTKKL